MPPIPRYGTVAVTGAAGFIGGWVVTKLLDKGYRVRACVRDADDATKTGFLKAMPGYVTDRLTIHSADLSNAGCFDDIFKGCHGVAHLSHLSDYNDLDHAKMVCDHIINSVNTSDSVTRIIVTSSMAAVVGERNFDEMVKRPVIYEDRYPDADHPRVSGYSYAKQHAEHAFAEAAEDSVMWDSITCCPSDNVGPIQSKHQAKGGPWQGLMRKMLLGECDPGVHGYRPWHTFDVRDTAECFVALLESVHVKNGERFLAISTNKIDVEEVCARIDRLLPELGFATPDTTEDLDEAGLKRKQERKAVYAGTEVRNDRIRAFMPIEFRDLDDSLRDMAESLITVGEVTPVLRPGSSLRT